MKGLKINWKAVPEAFKLLGKLSKEHAPSILVGAGVVGFGVTCYLVAEAAPKAETAIERAEETVEENIDEPERIDIWKKVKIVAPYYWKAGISGGLTLGCFLTAHKVNLLRLSSLGSMYAIARSDLKELKDKIVQTDGEKKLDTLQNSICQDKRERANYDDIYDTGYGDVIFIDDYTGQVFKSSIPAVRNAIIELNAKLQEDGEAELSEFLYDLGLKFDRKCASYAKFVYQSKQDAIKDYSIMHYGPLSAADPTPVCVLEYSDYLVPTSDFAERYMHYLG